MNLFYEEYLKTRVKGLREMEAAVSQPETAKDNALFQKLTKEMARLRPLTDSYEKFCRLRKEYEAVQGELAVEGLDGEMKSLYQDEAAKLEKQLEVLQEKMERLLLRGSDPRTGRDVIVEIRAGTGGEEAALFAADLYRMYSRAASEHGCRVEVINASETGIGGCKEVVFSVAGEEAYSLLKYESGIHRVQRVPSTESSGRIHTSAVTVAIMAEATETEVDLDPGDLKIDVYRASGAGGQHVNKTESAVRITHLPTGVVVTCQEERSQHKNKAKAMRVLRARLYEAQEQKRQAEMADERKQKVGSGDRSGKIRTYNFPDSRVTDHRIGLTLHSLSAILDGHLDELVQALEQDEKQRRLSEIA